MTGKQALYKVRNCRLEIKSLEAEAETFRELATSATAAMTDVRVQTSNNNSKENVLIALADKNSDISQKLADCLRFINEVDKLLGQMEDARKSSILRLKYISCYSNRKIQRIMGYSQSWTSKLHEEAVNEFQKLYKEKGQL